MGLKGFRVTPCELQQLAVNQNLTVGLRGVPKVEGLRVSGLG